jgi:hypothetical protein
MARKLWNRQVQKPIWLLNLKRRIRNIFTCSFAFLVTAGEGKKLHRKPEAE